MGRSDFLFATPTFITGAGRVFDLWGSLEYYNYNLSRTPEEADSKAIANDWLVVRNDLTAAIRKVSQDLDSEE